MVSFERLLFCYETCLNCALLPAKTCAACAGTGLVIRRVQPHPRPHPDSVQMVLKQLCQDIDLLTCDEEDARAIGNRSLMLTIAGRRAGLAQAALRLQTWLAVQTAEPMPRGKNGAVH